MKKFTIFIVLLVLCVLLAIWAPWTSWKFSLSSLFGIKQSQDVSGLQVYSLSGKLDVYLDGEKIGSSTEGADPFAKDNIAPGEHLLSLVRQSERTDAFWNFSKVTTFYKGATVVASYNLGPSEEFSEGHVIYATGNSNPDNKSNLSLNSNVEGATLKIDSNPEQNFNGKTLNTELSLDSQHSILIHKTGYDDLKFTILPSNQEDRDLLKNLILNIDAHLMLQPVQIEVTSGK